jgi:hypothetical protein
MKAALRVEHVGQGEKVLLARPTAVVEDEQPRRIASGGALLVDEIGHAQVRLSWLACRFSDARFAPFLPHG